jgi:hypothetical protein
MSLSAMTDLHPDSELIAAIGGSTAVARLCGLRASSIGLWKRFGIPAKHRHTLVQARLEQLDVRTEQAANEFARRRREIEAAGRLLAHRSSEPATTTNRRPGVDRELNDFDFDAIWLAAREQWVAMRGDKPLPDLVSEARKARLALYGVSLSGMSSPPSESPEG